MSEKNTSTYSKQAFLALCLMEIVWIGIIFNALSLFAAPVTEDWGIPRSGYMLVLTICPTCATIGSFIYGAVLERMGTRKMITFASCLGIIGLVIFGLAQNVAMLYIAAVFLGMGCSFMNAQAVNAICQRWFKKNTATRISIANTCGSVAGIVSATVMAAVINAAGWHTSYFILAGIGVIGLLVVVPLYKGDPHELGVKAVGEDEVAQEGSADAGAAASETGLSYSDTMKTAKFWFVAIVMFVAGVAGYAVLANLPLIVSDFGFAEQSGMLLSTALLAAAVLAIPCGRILDKFGSAVMCVVCYGLFLISMIMLAMGMVNQVTVYLIAACVGAGYDFVLIAPGIVTLETIGSKDYAKKMGTVGGFTYAGVALGPTVMSLFFDLGGGTYETAYILFAILSIVVMILMFPMTKGAKKQAA